MKKNIIIALVIFIVELILRFIFYLTINYTVKENYASYQALMLPFIFLLDLSGLGLFPAMSYYTSKNVHNTAPKRGYLLFLGAIFGIVYLLLASINGLHTSKIVISLSFLIMPYLQTLRGFFQGMGKYHIPTISIVIEMIVRISVYFLGYFLKYDVLTTVAFANSLGYYLSLFYLIFMQRKYSKISINGLLGHGIKLLPISTITSSMHFFDYVLISLIQIPDITSSAYLFKIIRLVSLPIYFSRTLSSLFLVSNAKHNSKIYPLVILTCIIYIIIARPLVVLYENTYHEPIVMKLYGISLATSLLHSLIKIFSSNLYTKNEIKGLSIIFTMLTVLFCILGLILGVKYHLFGITIANFIIVFILFMATLAYYYKLNLK